MLKKSHFCSSLGRPWRPHTAGSAEPCPTTSSSPPVPPPGPARHRGRRRIALASGLVASFPAEASVIAE